MEGKRIDERQKKKTEDKETSSQHGSGFHKNSDELANACSVEEGGNTLESTGNGGFNQGAHPPFNFNPLQEGCPRANTIDELANLNDGELLSQIVREQQSSFDQIAAEGIEWWSKRLDKMSPEEFQQFYAALGILRVRVQTHLQQRIRIRDSNSGETSNSSSSTDANGRGRARRKRR